MTPRPTRTYLDWNATAPLHPAARAAMVAALDITGNPSSPHAEGRRARGIVEDARERIGASLGVAPRNVYFTSGATEAANWVLSPTAATGQRMPLAALLVAATEHTCVLAGHRFPAERVSTIPVDGQGLVDVAALAARVAELTRQHGNGSVMVAVQAANNETGVLQPMAQIAEALAPHGALLVCDAVQAVGRMPDVPKADILLLSAHKVGGPKGVGAVAFASEAVSPEPLIKGGGQERRQRSGTENVAGIAGFAAALEAAIATSSQAIAHARQLRDTLETGLARIHGGTVVFGASAPRLPNTTCFAVPGVAAETALIALDLDGMAVSSGSACASGKVASSHVLAAMGAPIETARGALRLSTGAATTQQDVEAFLAAWHQFIARRAQRAVA